MGFVVVGLDGSETSRDAFHQAIREAEWRDTRLEVVHVVSFPVAMGHEFAVPFDLESLRSAAEQFLANELTGLRGQYDDDFPVAVSHHVAIGHFGTEIIRAAEGSTTETAELVVLGSRGLGGFRGLLLGSVTTYAVHHLTCPLLIVPAAAESGS